MATNYSTVAVDLVLNLMIMGFIVLLHPHNNFCNAKQFHVDDHVEGVLGTDITNDTLNNWKKSCASGTGLFELSTGNYQLGPLTFQGPCKGGKMVVNVIGTITAIPKSAWPSNTNTWIKFLNIPNLHITGAGSFDGQGSGWWNTCSKTLPNTCENNPTALAFHSCHGLVLDRVTSTNSQRNHISINACHGATINDVKISISPNRDAPNTDGIDISATNGVHILGGNIRTGDDCVAINAGSYNINITNLECGPGHGISIGSLGRNSAKESVGNIMVSGAIFSGTQNGVRIKTVPGGSGSANQITFNNITMSNVQHPIVVTQFYCPHVDPVNCTDKESFVQIKDVSFNDIHGTSSTNDAINIHCSKYPNSCVGIKLQNIGIQGGNPSVKAEATCKNTIVGLTPPVIPSVKCIRASSLWGYNYNKSRKLNKH